MLEGMNFYEKHIKRSNTNTYSDLAQSMEMEDNLQTVNINFIVYCLASAPVCAILCSSKRKGGMIYG